MRRVVKALEAAIEATPRAAVVAFAAAAAMATGSALVVSGCKGPMAKIEGVREALEQDDAAAIKSAVEGFPPCADAPPVALTVSQAAPRDTGCFAQIATALGSNRGFNYSPPDQAAATTAAVVLMRDGRGDWLAHVDSWLNSIKVGKGPGPDGLRLAVARRMAEGAPQVGRKIDDDQAAAAAMKAVATAIPGACPTYWLLGTGTAPATLAVEHSAEHSACVQRDLQRREGPGASYGDGMFRALEGSLAIWRETERSLRLGVANSSPATKSVLEGRLKVIETATQAIATKRVESSVAAPITEMLGDVHAEAGIILWKDAGAKEAGPEGGADADAPTTPARKH